jgi:hypothetical protein
MGRKYIKLSITKINAIKYWEDNVGYFIIPLDEIAIRMRKFVVKLFKGEHNLKRLGLILETYPVILESGDKSEIYLVTEVRKATEEPKTPNEIKAIIKPTETEKGSEKGGEK